MFLSIEKSLLGTLEALFGRRGYIGRMFYLIPSSLWAGFSFSGIQFKLNGIFFL